MNVPNRTRSENGAHEFCVPGLAAGCRHRSAMGCRRRRRCSPGRLAEIRRLIAADEYLTEEKLEAAIGCLHALLVSPRAPVRVSA